MSNAAAVASAGDGVSYHSSRRHLEGTASFPFDGAGGFARHV